VESKTIPELILHRHLLSNIDQTKVPYLHPETIIYEDNNIVYEYKQVKRPIEMFPENELSVEYYESQDIERILPMKAKDYVPRRHKEWLKDNKVCAQIKQDGVRATVHIRNGVNRVFAGRIVKNGWTGEKSDQLPHIRDYSMKEFRGTVLDGEIVSPTGHTPEDFKHASGTLNSKPMKALENQFDKGFLYFICFDIIYYKGYDVRNMPYKFRYHLLNSLLTREDNLPKNPYMIPATTVWGEQEKVDLLEYASEIGCEGIMLRQNKLPYTYDYKSGQMLKLKDKITLDMVCIGFYEANEGKTGQFKGLIGGMMLGVFMKPEEAKKRRLKEYLDYTHFVTGETYQLERVKGRVLVHLGNISGMNVTERKDMTNDPTKYLNEVVELQCNRTYPDSRIPRNPRFMRLHGQKNANQITFESHCEQADVLQLLEV
jgi:ATP-dependent DNA ligase